jgi:hypothetical protein
MDDQAMAQGGRVVRISIAQRGRGSPVDQWFIVGIDDDIEAAKAVAKPNLADAKVEIMGVLTPDVAAQWNLRYGEVKPSAPRAGAEP